MSREDAGGAVLTAREIVAGYEPDLPIVTGASLEAAPGEIVAVLGPNGAGKSTFIKALAGLVPVSSGSVRLGAADITGLAAHRRMRAGLGFVPQTENIFATLSVEDNLRLAGDALADTRLAAERRAEIFAMFPDLVRARAAAAGRLSGGQRQMLAVGRALMASPRVIMLDEPSAGLSPKLVDEVFSRLLRIRDRGVAIVLVEQNVRSALAIADRAVILVEGRNRHEGRASELRQDPILGELYLGLGRRTAPLPA